MTIHTLVIRAEMQPADLIRETRKRLMTGGCVIRLATDLSNSDRMQLLERFLPHYEKGGIIGELLRQIARDPGIGDKERHLLQLIGDPLIQSALDTERSDIRGA